jgi:hypothetical protein
MTVPPPAMDHSAKAVISELLARDVTPVLRRHGFAGRGRTFRRVGTGRQELPSGVVVASWKTASPYPVANHSGLRSSHQAESAPSGSSAVDNAGGSSQNSGT